MTLVNATVVRGTGISRTAIATTVVVWVLLALAPAVLSFAALDRLAILFVYIILALSWNALAGYAGLVSVGQQLFFGMGAYLVIRLADAGTNVFLAVGLSAVFVAIIAAILSRLMLQLKGGEFAVGMWVLSELAYLLVKLDTRVQGDTGTSLIAMNSYPSGVRQTSAYLVAFAGMTIVIIVLYAFLRSKAGAALQAIRDDEDAAVAVGVRLTALKSSVFIFAAFAAALAGAVWLTSAITFQPRAYFGVHWTAYMIFMVLVGGIGTFEGAILGAVLFFLVEWIFSALGAWYLVGLGFTAVVFSLLLPYGVFGYLQRRWDLHFLPVGYFVRWRR